MFCCKVSLMVLWLIISLIIICNYLWTVLNLIATASTIRNFLYWLLWNLFFVICIPKLASTGLTFWLGPALYHPLSSCLLIEKWKKNCIRWCYLVIGGRFIDIDLWFNRWMLFSGNKWVEDATPFSGLFVTCSKNGGTPCSFFPGSPGTLYLIHLWISCF